MTVLAYDFLRFPDGKVSRLPRFKGVGRDCPKHGAKTDKKRASTTRQELFHYVFSFLLANVQSQMQEQGLFEEGQVAVPPLKRVSRCSICRVRGPVTSSICLVWQLVWTHCPR